MKHVDYDANTNCLAGAAAVFAVAKVTVTREWLHGLADRLGRLGNRLRRLGNRLGRLGNRLGRLGNRLGRLGNRLGRLRRLNALAVLAHLTTTAGTNNTLALAVLAHKSTLARRRRSWLSG